MLQGDLMAADADTAPQTVVETERLVVRPWRAAEASRLLDILRRLEVARWLGDGEPVAGGRPTDRHGAAGPDGQVVRRTLDPLQGLGADGYGRPRDP
jgi:hypothetical protein